MKDRLKEGRRERERRGREGRKGEGERAFVCVCVRSFVHLWVIRISLLRCVAMMLALHCIRRWHRRVALLHAVQPPYAFIVVVRGRAATTAAAGDSVNANAHAAQQAYEGEQGE